MRSITYSITRTLSHFIIVYIVGLVACCNQQDQENQFTNLPIDYTNPFGMDFTLIAPGSFTMGSDSIRGDNSRPIHHVNITKPYYIGRYEVTINEWHTIMGGMQSSSDRTPSDNPISNVDYFDAKSFISALNRKDNGRHYRLPTEAEWEYACKAGDSRDKPMSIRNLRRYAVFGDTPPQRVGTRKANPWGLYDMIGNAEEWVEDVYTDYNEDEKFDPRYPGHFWSYIGAKHVLRGGDSFEKTNETLNCVDRYGDLPLKTYDTRGFRLALDPINL